MARTIPSNYEGAVVLNSSEWTTIRHALETAAEKWRDVAADVLAESVDPANPVVIRLAAQLTAQALDCDKLVEFIDAEGLV